MSPGKRPYPFRDIASKLERLQEHSRILWITRRRSKALKTSEDAEERKAAEDLMSATTR